MLIRFVRTSLQRRSVCYRFSTSEKEISLKEKIMRSSLLYVNKNGWNEQAIVSGCLDLNLSSVSSRIFPRGTYDLIAFAMDDWNNIMAREMEKCELEKMTTVERIRTGVKIRLSQQIPFINKWHEAMAVGLYPENITETLRKIWKISDDVWFLSGDRSYDLSWYTKRTLLTEIYIKTELFMLTDKSDNFSETWKFLDRRLEETFVVGGILNKSKEVVSSAFTGVLSILGIFKPFPERHDVNMSEIQARLKKLYEEKLV